MYSLIFAIILLLIFVVVKSPCFYIESQQDLNLDKEFKTKKHFFYERCSVCGKRLKHARSGKIGDVMYCTVECRGKTTWYCEECYNEIMKNTVYEAPKIGEEYDGNI